MTPHQYANEWCEKRGYCLIALITSKHICEASKLNALIIDMRLFHWFKWPEIAEVVHRSKGYCRAVWKESRMKARAA